MQIVVPVHLDSPERLESFRLVVDYLCRLGYPVVLSEVAESPRAIVPYLGRERVRCCWAQSNGRQLLAQAINGGLALVDDDVVGLWDLDCWLPRERIAVGERLVSRHYDFLCVGASVEDLKRSAIAEVLASAAETTVLDEERLARHVFQRRSSPNGTVRFVRTRVIKHLRGVNDRFLGWGCEDDELVSRFLRLGYRVGRLGGPVWHLSHPPTASGLDRRIHASGLLYGKRLGKLDPPELAAYYGVSDRPGEFFGEQLRLPSTEEADEFWSKTERSHAWLPVTPGESAEGE